jgi:hypothetical protein
MLAEPIDCREGRGGRMRPFVNHECTHLRVASPSEMAYVTNS